MTQKQAEIISKENPQPEQDVVQTKGDQETNGNQEKEQQPQQQDESQNANIDQLNKKPEGNQHEPENHEVTKESKKKSKGKNQERRKKQDQKTGEQAAQGVSAAAAFLDETRDPNKDLANDTQSESQKPTALPTHDQDFLQLQPSDQVNKNQSQTQETQHEQQQQQQQESVKEEKPTDSGELLANSGIPKESTESKKSWATQAGQSQNEKDRRQDETAGGQSFLGYEWQLCNVTAGPDYIPCLDNEKAIKALHHTMHFEHRERHCPEEGPMCLVPVPELYRKPIKWPESRDKVRLN